MPYVFQLLSLLVEQRTLSGTGGISEGSPYMSLVGCLLAPPLWDKPANVKALVRLLCALTSAAHQHLIRDNRLVIHFVFRIKLILFNTNFQTFIERNVGCVPKIDSVQSQRSRRVHADSVHASAHARVS